MTKKLGLSSVVATGIGLIVATSCLVMMGQGAGAVGSVFIIAMVLACVLNIIAALSMAELNALMPGLTGGLAQYTLTCLGPFIAIVTMVGGYLFCNSLAASSEGAMFGIIFAEVTGLGIPSWVYSVVITVLLVIVNLLGVDMFAKIQGIVAGLLVGSLLLLGLIGTFGLGTGVEVDQAWSLSTDASAILSVTPIAFWLFVGVEYIVPLAKDIKNPQRNIPLGMVLSLIIICVLQTFIVLGFHNYTSWGDLAAADSPHILYGVSMLGNAGRVWMAIVSILAAVSTLNSVIGSLARICWGMAKIDLLPAVFLKTNRYNVPVSGILLIGILICGIQLSGISTADDVAFLISVGSVFWMISYAVTHINVLVLRHRLSKAPRTFKVPFCPVLQIVGIAGMVYMILNIDSNPAVRGRVLLLSLIVFVLLAVYAVLWIKLHMRRRVFKSYSLYEVVAMEAVEADSVNSFLMF